MNANTCACCWKEITVEDEDAREVEIEGLLAGTWGCCDGCADDIIDATRANWSTYEELGA